MSENGLERLLWQEIDGSLEDRERERLTRRLAEDEGARRLRDEVGETARLLSGARQVAPPPELLGRIRTAVAERPAPARAKKWWALAAWASHPASRYVYLAAGIVIGVTSVLLVSRGVEMGSGEALVGTLNVGEQSGGQNLELGESRGFVRLRRQGDTWSAAFDVTAGPELSIRFFSGGEAVPIERATPEPGFAPPRIEGPSTVVLEEGRSQLLVLEFRAPDRGAAPVRLRVVSGDGRIVLEQVLEEAGG